MPRRFSILNLVFFVVFVFLLTILFVHVLTRVPKREAILIGHNSSYSNCLLSTAVEYQYFREKNLAIQIVNNPDTKALIQQLNDDIITLVALSESDLLANNPDFSKIKIISTTKQFSSNYAFVFNKSKYKDAKDALKQEILVSSNPSDMIFLSNLAAYLGYDVNNLKTRIVTSVENELINNNQNTGILSNASDFIKSHNLEQQYYLQYSITNNNDLLIGNIQKMSDNKLSIQSILEALAETEEMLNNKPEVRLAMLSQEMPNMTKDQLRDIDKNSKQRVRLNNILLNDLSKELKFYGYENLKPEYLIADNYLKAVKPEYVTITK